MKFNIIGVVVSKKFSLMDGLKNFGDPEEKYSVKELNQIHYITTFIPLDPNKLTIEDRIKALSSLMFLVDKRDGNIKARTCAYGREQRRDDNYNKHDYASPTCANNSIMITSDLEAKEGRYVAIIGIPGAYLHTYVDKHGKQIIIMLFKEKLA